MFAGELAEGGTQEVGSADKLRDLRSAAAVGTGAGGLAREERGQGTGQAGSVDEFVLFGRSMGLGQAAVELQASFALLL